MKHLKQTEYQDDGSGIMEIAIAHDTERAEELLDEGWTLFNSGANIYQNSGQARSWFHFFKVSGSHE